MVVMRLPRVGECDVARRILPFQRSPYVQHEVLSGKKLETSFLFFGLPALIAGKC